VVLIIVVYKKRLLSFLALIIIGVILFAVIAKVSIKVISEMLPVNNPEAIKTEPADRERGVHLFREITVKTGYPVERARVEIAGVPGRTFVHGQNVIFKPAKVLMPATEYQVRVFIKTPDQLRWNNYKFNFTTMDVQDKIWVAVDLNGLNTVTVYRGKMPLRTMLASGGRTGHETPLGIFYTRDRGHSFWSARYGEGAYYWVRITGQYLFHSVPVDNRWRTKEEEHAKLGCPASHGCVRLNIIDAKWFYENVPRGSMVIIHN
jgi:lipoprotein-anchoring transpeptidase ErfK/SrfK